MEDHHQRLGPLALQQQPQRLLHRLLLLMPIRQVGEQLRNGAGAYGGAAVSGAGGDAATEVAPALALLQLAQGALHQVGEMVWIAEALHCDTAVADALQEGVLPLAVLPIHQGLRWHRQL